MEDIRLLVGSVEMAPRWDAHAQAIGYVAIHSAHLEMQLASIIASVADLDSRTAQALLAGMQAAVLIDRLQTLVAAREDEEAAAALKEWAAKARTAMDRRNQIIHSAWFMGIEEDTMLRGKIQKGAPAGFPGELTTTTAVIAEAHGLLKLIDDLAALAQKHGLGVRPPGIDQPGRSE